MCELHVVVTKNLTQYSLLRKVDSNSTQLPFFVLKVLNRYKTPLFAVESGVFKMASTEENESTVRKLADMRVVDLRHELEKRGLDKGGVKASLVERLAKALQDEGNDPEEYLFNVPAEGTPTKKPIAQRSNRKVNDSDSNLDSQEDMGNEEDLERGDTDDEKNMVEGDDAGEDVAEDALQLSVGEEEKLNEEEENADSRGKDDTQSDLDGDLEPSVCEGSSDLGQEDKNEEKPKEEGGDKEKNINHCSKPAEASEVMSVEVEDEELDETAKEQAASKGSEGNKETDAGDSQQKSTEEEKAKNEESSASGKASSETPAVSTSTSTSTTSKSKSTTVKNAKVPSKDEKDRPKREPQSTRNLWVSGLAPGTRATELKTLFSKQGKVVGAKIVTNARTPGARCYGFVTMATSEEASKCIQHLHRTELNGRIISVERTRHEPGGMLRKTETKTALTVKKLAQKREIKPTAKSSEAAKAKESQKSKDGEGDKPEQEGEPAKDSETAQEKETDKEGKERETSRDKSRERDRERGPREPRSVSRGRDYRSRPFGRAREARAFHLRGRGRGLRGSFRDRLSFRKPYFMKRPFLQKPGFQSGFKSNLVAFQKIKEERRRQRIREREIRENERRRAQEIFRQRSIERKQREESIRLERERERLRIEREKLERERAEVLRLEREKQRLERERLEREREELRRREQMSRIEEPRRAMKRPFRGSRENDSYWEDRKRPSLSGRYHDYDNRERSYDRHDLFERRGERYEGREKALEVAAREFGDVRREVRREQSTHDRDDRRVPERPERYNRNPSREADARAREHREIRDPGRGAPTRERERMGPPRSSPPVRARPPPRDEWKSQPHDRRMHDRYMETGGKVMSGPGGSFSSSRSYSGDRGESWGGSADKGMGKSYSSSSVMGGGSQWGSADSRKMDSSHGQSWGRVENSQANRWGGSMDSRNARGQQGMGMGQAQPGMYGGNSQQMGSMTSHSSMSGSGYASDRYMTGMRRY